MSNFSINLLADANTSRAVAEIARLQAQVRALNTDLEAVGKADFGTVSKDKWANLQNKVKQTSESMRAAAQSTGLWQAEQVKVRSATEAYTEALQRQKVGLKEWSKSRKLAMESYKEQLRLQSAVATQLPMTGPGGKQVFDVYTPTQFNKTLDTTYQRIGYVREHLKSLSTQMVNWGKNTQWAGRQLMVGFTLPVVAFGAAAGMAAYQVDKELTRIQKVYDTTSQVVAGNQQSMIAVEKELSNVREAGLRTASMAAEKYAQSAKDTLNVQAELAATGLRGAKLQKSTEEVMRISTLGELERQDAIEATIALQAIFRMSNEELTKSFDYMNAVENATSLQTKDFAQAIPIAAGPIKAFGGDIYELGVLMTAMKERGIEASQGANALKAAMQRLGRPSKIVREEFSQLTGESITDIVENSDSLTEILQKVGQAVEGLPRADRIKVIAGLFGSWQVTRFDAMVQGLRDVENGVGQAGKAFRIAKKDPGEWAAAAETEIERMQKSVSFQFKAAFETIRAELAEAGGIWLLVAAKIMKGIAWVIKGFNELGPVTKLLLSLPIVLLALAGPIIMLTGLMANFGGNIIKFGVTLTGALGKMDLLNRESAVAKKASELAAAGYGMQSTAVENLTRHFEMLAIAMARAHNIPLGDLTPAGGAMGMTAAQMAAAGVSYNSAGQVVWAQSDAAKGRRKGGFVSHNDLAALKVQQEAMKDIAKDSLVTEKAAAKTKRNWGGAATTIAFAAGSLAMMSGHAEGTSQSILNWVMTFALLGPLMTPMVRKGWELVRWTREAEGGSGRMKRGWKDIGKLMLNPVALMMKLVRLINPWVAGITAAVGVFLAIKELNENSLERQKMINNSAKSWAEYVGATYKGYESIAKVQKEMQDASFEDRAREFGQTDVGQSLLIGYRGNETKTDKMTFALNEYNKILETTDASASDARKAIATLFYLDTGSFYKANQLLNEFRERAKGAGDNAKTAEGRIDNLGSAIETAMNRANEGMDMEDWLWGSKYETGGWKDWYRVPTRIVEDALSSAADEAEASGDLIGQRLGAALKKVRSPIKKFQLIEDLKRSLDVQWTNALQSLEADTEALLSRMGVTTGGQFRSMIEELETMDPNSFQKKYGINMQEYGMLQNQVMKKAEVIRGIERGIVKNLANQMQLQGNITTFLGLQTRETWKQLGASKKLLMIELRRLNARAVSFNVAGMEFGISQKQWKQSVYSNDKLNNKEKLRMFNLFAISKEQKLQNLNLLRQEVGLAKTTRYADLFGKATREGKNELAGAAGQASRLASLMGQISGQHITDMAKDAMGNLQQDMADKAMANFESAQSRAMEAVEAAGERRMDQFEAHAENVQRAMERRHEAAQAAMERRHENQMDSLEDRQERRRKRIENSYDKRIEAIDKAIKAEQRAEEIRQRIFDAEMKRLDRWAEMANRNIDFNVAMNSGNLDEAAKIRNEGIAAVSQWALEDDAESQSSRSERRIDKLEGRKDQIEEARDKELDAIAKVEEAERKSLERRQERQKKALERRLEAEQRALEKSLEHQRKNLEKSIEANRKAEERKWEAKRNYLEKSLADFTRYIAKDAKDLRKHIKLWKDEHKGLSDDTRKQFNISTDKINNYLVAEMKKSRRAIVNEIEWAEGGKKIASGMIKGAFGLNLKQFRKWMVTGKMPSGGGSNGGGGGGGNNGNGSNSSHPTQPGNNGGNYNPPNNHTGGWAGTYDNRKGVARTMGGKRHPSEIDIRARKGQFIVNEHASKKYGGILEAINSGLNPTVRGEPGMRGTDVPSPRQKSRTGGYGMATGISGIMLAAMSAAASGAINRGMHQGAEAARARAAAMSGGTFGAGAAGKYGDMFFSKEQLKNAATIASVGSKMGMSKRDIQIGIMTAITESGLRNVNYGHLDSLGLFQQRASWGTAKQRTTPEWAARAFFGPLKGHGERNSESPWLAAQHIQRSAYSDGSNYKKHWDEAQAIFKEGLKKSSGVSGGYVVGSGGRHRPVKGGTITQKLHDTGTAYPAWDIGVPVGTKVYAVGNGKISGSYDLVGNDGRRSNGGYYSYGRVITLNLDNGPSVLYAHLSRRSVKKGQSVKGGAVIGRSGNTGHSFGPHLHFGTSSGSPGVFLKTGGIVKQDGTPAVLHKNEAVLTEPLSNELRAGIGGISDAGEILKQIQRAGVSYGAYDRTRVGQVMNYLYDIKKKKDSDSGSGSGNGGGGGGSVGGSNTGGQNTHSGKQGNVRVGTYNVAWKTGLGTTAPDLKRLMAKSDILGLQEVYRGGRQKRVMKTFNQGNWGYSPYLKDSMIAWNKKMFEKIKAGNQGLNPHMTGGGRNSVNRYAAWALLRNKKTHKRLWAVSTHLQPFANSSPRLAAIQRLQFQNLEKMYNKMNKTAPVVMVGDFNRDLFRHKGSIPKGMKTSRKGPKDGLGGTHGKNNLDFVLMGKSIKAMGNTILRKGFDSDHNALIANLKIPGMSEGGFTLSDGIARLHKKETVLTAPLSEKLNVGIDRLAEGTGNTYHVTVNATRADINEDELANKTARTIRRQEARKATSRRTGK